MKIKFIILFIILLFFNLIFAGCTDNVDKQAALVQDVNTYKTKIQELEEKIKQLEEENESKAERIREINRRIVELETIDYQDNLEKYYYRQDKVQNQLGYKRYEGDEPLRAFPYSNAPEVNKGSPADVRVVATVKNKYDDNWALVEFYERRKNNYGFVKAEYLKDYENIDDDTPDNIPIGMEGIHIGDMIEKAVVELGTDYAEIKELNMPGGFICYDQGLDIFYDRLTHKIWYIRTSEEGNLTSEGYGVGDNAKEAVDYYKTNYSMNMKEEVIRFDESASYFNLGNDYVLKLDIDMEDLTEESVIKRIDIAPEWWFSKPG